MVGSSRDLPVVFRFAAVVWEAEGLVVIGLIVLVEVRHPGSRDESRHHWRSAQLRVLGKEEEELRKRSWVRIVRWTRKRSC